LLWRSISVHHDDTSYTGSAIVVADRSRESLARWPLNLEARSEVVRTSIETASVKLIDLLVSPIGYVCITKGDETFFLPQHFVRRLSPDATFVRPLSTGENIRNWQRDDDLALFPYEADTWKLVVLNSLPYEWFFRALRGPMSERITFGKSQAERGKWYEYAMISPDRLRRRLVVAMPEISTHSHALVLSQPFLASQTAPVSSLRADSKEAHMLATALLNSSTALFWLKQVCFNKGAGEDEERDRYVFAGGKVEQLPVPERIAAALKGEANPLATRLAELAQACWERGQLLPSLAMKKLFEMPGEAYYKWNSSLPGHVKPHEIIGAPFESAEELQQSFERVVAERERLRSEMIALQEDMDWLVYAAYGLLPDDSPALSPLTPTLSPQAGRGGTGEIEPLDKDLRPYRLWLKAEGNFDKAVSFIPSPLNGRGQGEGDSGWSEARRNLWRARLEAIRDNEHIRRIEQPVYKRRWDEQWKVKNRWECGEIAYQTELRDAFDSWLREKAEWWLEHKAKDQQATLHDLAEALWRNERVHAAVSFLFPSPLWGEGQGEGVPSDFERLLKEVVDEETVPAGIPFAKPWDKFSKDTPGLPKARKIRGKLNVPRERFHLVTKNVYSWAGKLFRCE
jgi:hypothetical protein